MPIKFMLVTLATFILAGCDSAGSNTQVMPMKITPSTKGLLINAMILFKDDIYAYETSLLGEGGRYHASNIKMMSNGLMGDKDYKFLERYPAGTHFRLIDKFTERAGPDFFSYLLITSLNGKYSGISFKYLLGATGSLPTTVDE